MAYRDPMFGLGMRMMAHGGPSLTPTNALQQAGKAGLGWMQDQRALMQEALQKKIQEKKLEALEKELKDEERKQKLTERYADLYSNYLTGTDIAPRGEQASMLRDQMQGLRSPQETMAGLGQLMFQQGAQMGSPNMMQAGLGQMTPPDPLERELTASQIYKNLQTANRAGPKFTKSDRVMELSKKLATGEATKAEQQEYFYLINADPITRAIMMSQSGQPVNNPNSADPLGLKQ